jgi:predicted nucleic acid-binding protein
MIVLDTNVLSELTRPAPAERVLHWISSQSAVALYVTTMSYAEISTGIGLMPDGKRRRQLAEQAASMFNEDFAERILGFDMPAASAFAAISVQRQQSGRRTALSTG